MSFHDDIEADLAANHYSSDEFARSATFTPGSGTPVICTVVPDNNRSNIELFLQADARTMIVSVQKAEVSAVHPGADKMTIGTDTWRVDSVILEDDFEFMLLLVKDI